MLVLEIVLVQLLFAWAFALMCRCIPPTGSPAYRDFLSVMYESQT